MNKNHFDNAVRIAAFRGIAEQLLEKNLITQGEFKVIRRRLNNTERKLLAGCQHGNSHARQICQKDQPKMDWTLSP